MNISESLKKSYLQTYPAEVVKLVEASPELISNLAQLPSTNLHEFFDRADPSMLRDLFLRLPKGRHCEIIESATVRIALLILRALEPEERQQILEGVDGFARSELSQLLELSEHTAGYYMDGPTAKYELSDTVGVALQKLQSAKRQRVRSIYVVDEENKLAGRVDMQDMALSGNDTLLSNILVPVEGVVQLMSPRQELLEIFEKTRVDSIPLVDQEMRLLGIVRYASLFKAAEDDATVDLQKMVGASSEEKALSPALFAVKKRLPWLHINLLTAFLAASVVGVFESTIAQFTALAILLPVVAGQSGNAGSQALAVTMRGLALKEINSLQWKSVLFKELKIGIIDGLALAVTCGLGVWVWSQSAGLALVIAVAMVTSMIAAGIAGALVPIVLIRAGQDPATASSIILTTVTDISGFISFLGTATLLSFML